MERAALALADECMLLLKDAHKKPREAKALCVCGTGKIAHADPRQIHAVQCLDDALLHIVGAGVCLRFGSGLLIHVAGDHKRDPDPRVKWRL